MLPALCMLPALVLEACPLATCENWPDNFDQQVKIQKEAEIAKFSSPLRELAVDKQYF